MRSFLVFLNEIMAVEFSIESNSEAETRAIARKLARYFHSGDVIILDGDLGAGKTYFVKGFSDGFHSIDLVSSPTFSIANFYGTTAVDILHIDLYRISTVEEFNDLGLQDYFNQSIVLVEWGKKFASFFEDYLLISFEIHERGNEGCRTLTFSYIGNKYKPIMGELKKTLKGKELC